MTTVDLHIEYSQNGRTISDEVFSSIPLSGIWSETNTLPARQAAWSLLDEMGCGSAAVYVQTPDARIYLSTRMCCVAHRA